MQKLYRKSKQSRQNNRRTDRRAKGLEHLESRQLMAAHIVGDPTVYATIQAAVDAALPNATVNVDAGSYSEQVYIGKTITIRGAEAGVDARSNVRAGAAETIMNGLMLTDGTHTSSFYIAANDVTIDGFTVQGNTTVGPTGAGMVIAPSMHGTHVINNIIQNNVSGLFLANNSTTDPAIIRFNLFRNNNNAGSDGGRGIYTDGGISGGNLTNVLIDSNAFMNNYGSTGTTTLEAAIALESRTLGSQHYITVTNNSFDGDGKGVLMYNADHIDIENNEVTYLKDQWSGVFRSEGGVSYVNVIGNTVYSSTGPAVRIDEKGFAGPNFNWVVTGNNFYNNSTAYTNKQSVVLSALNQYDGTFIVTNNYWGSASGPSGDGPGTGDNLTLSGNSAVYSPWATSMIGTGRMPYYGAPLSTDAVVQLEDYDQGGEGVAYHDVDAGNSGGQYRKGPTAVDIGTSTDSGGGAYIIESVKGGEWLKYTINATQSGTYTIGIRVAAGVGGGTFHLMIDGINVTGTMTVPTTGTNTFTTLTKTGVALTAGLHDVQLVFDGNSSGGTVGTFNWMQFTNTTPPAVPVSSTSLAGLAATFSTVNLNWLDNSTNETGFVIERRALPYGTWTSVTTVAANVTSFTDTTATAGTTYSYRIRSINAAGQSGNSNEFNVATPPQQDTTYVSDLPYASTPVNGWGPVERDQSVGSSNANDGGVITLNGVTYTKGLGTNAISDVTYTLGGAYGTFISDIGIDDKQLYDGTVIFQVFADGTKIYDSGVMTPDSATQTINVSVVGVQMLELHVDDAGDGPDFDQADWAGARLLLAPPAVVAQVPGTPTGLSADAVSPTQINLTWADETGETGYEIQRSIDDISFTKIGTAPAGATSYNDGNLLSSTQYYYRIVATNAAGDSGYSSEVTATTSAAPLPAVAPSNLVAVVMSQSQISLTWADNSSDELNFILERAADGVTFTQIATPAANATSYIDTTGVASTTYTYRLRAINAVGTSINSNTATATTFAAPTAPTGPTNLVAAAISQTQINLSWTDNSGNETGFVIERSLDGVTFAQIATPAANITSYSDTTGLIAGTSYSYRVSAINAVGASTLSNVAAATTIAAPTAPLAPGNLVATAMSRTQINLSWADNSNNETGFIIERSTDNVTFAQIALPTINATSYSDATGLVAGTKFYYRVRAMNAVGQSANSNVANASTVAAPTVPSAPGNLVATAASQTQINLSWSDNSSDETGFAIERSTDNITFTQIATPAANATSYSDATGLNAGTLYYYRLHAINAVGSSLNSNVASVATLAPLVTSPTAPSGLVATAISTSQINLTWTDNANNELNFVIERSTDNVTFTQIATPTANATSYSDATGLSAGTLYYYRVRAGNSGGASANSNVASATTIAAPTAPLAPSNLVASAMSQTQVNLTWSDNSSNETGFIVERSTDNVAFTQIATPAANATSYSDAAGLSASTKFYYRVRATNSVGPSANSNVANATTLAPVVTIPSAPTNLVATANTTSQITLTWTDNANNETNFIVERSTDDVTFAQIATPAANATSMTDGSLNAGTVYYYRIRAGNSAGASANSNVASSTTLVAPTAPAAPSNLVATAMSQSQISLSWSDNSSNETGFVVERSIDNVSFTRIAAPASNSTSYSDSNGLAAGTQYFYRVSAINAVGSSAVSNVATATTPSAPLAPSNLVATAPSSSQINLTWTDNSTNETGFVIERSTDNANFAQIAAPAANATSYSDSTGLLGSTQYFYRILAINAVGSSVNSNVASATTAASVVLNLPAAPTNLVATVVSPTSIKLTWTDNSNNETNFIVERSNDGVTWAQLATPPANATSTTDGASLTAGKTLYYRVRAGNNDGASANSNVASVTIPTVQLPSAPSGLVASAASTSQINLTWTDNANNETGFIVERSTDGVTFTQIAAPAANATSYVDATGLSSGTKYFYRVRAINSAGASANSPIATATTLVSTALPSGWTDGDLGSTGKTGSASYTAGVYTVNGAGTGIGKTSDAMNFAGTTMSGNGTLTVRVASNTGTAGITMRDGTATNAKSVSLTVASDGTLTFNTHSTVGGNVATTSLGKITGAVYLRLVRSGNFVIAYTSTNGTKWTLAAYASVSMSTKLNVGMIETSKSTTTLATAKFDNVALVLG